MASEKGLRLPIGDGKVLITMASRTNAPEEAKVKPLFTEISEKNKGIRLNTLKSRLELDMSDKPFVIISGISAERLAIEYGQDVVQELVSSGKIQY